MKLEVFFRGGLVALPISFMLASSSVSAASDTPTTQRVAPRLEHISIWVEDTERTAKFLSDVLGLRLNTVKWELPADTEASGGLKLGFIDGNGIELTLMEPTSPGTGANDLKRLGNGTLADLDMEVDDFDAIWNQFEAAGMSFVNMDGKPFPPGQKGWTVEPYGLRLIYLPKNITQGINIEVYQRGPVATDILHMRDRGWQKMPPLGSDALKMTRTLVLVKDLEATARFLTEKLWLKPVAGASGTIHSAKGLKCQAFAAGNGSAIELVQPTTPGPVMDMLSTKGDGYLAGLVYKASNLKEFHKRMQARNITLNMRPTPGTNEQIMGCGALRAPTGYATIPRTVSQGIKITVTDN